jgi:hypothetical protein
MRIFTYAFNHPTYLQYQNKCLRKFIQEPFEFYCVDNASEQRYSDQFKIICEANNIHYLKNLEPDHSLAGESHYSALQWSWKTIISHTEEIIVMLDHDTFPIDFVSIIDFLGDALLAGAPQSKGVGIDYFHPSLMIFNTKNLPNKNSVSFKGSVIDDIATDIGGDLCHYFRNNPTVKKKIIKSGHMFADNPLLPADLIAKYGYLHVFEDVEGKFLHTRNGSNWAWFDKNTFDNRDRFIFELLDAKLK